MGMIITGIFVLLLTMAALAGRHDTRKRKIYHQPMRQDQWLMDDDAQWERAIAGY